MLSKYVAMGLSSLIGLGLAGYFPPPGPGDELPHPKKKVERPGPEEDLRKAHDLLHRLRAEERLGGRSEARIGDWTRRAVQYYRQGIRAHEQGEGRLAHEFGAISHDLARAAVHARNAMLFDRADDDLPAPPAGPEAGRAALPPPVRKDMRKVYDRLGDDDVATGARIYRDAARDLYNAARTDADAGRTDRAAELVRAAEAMTHVVDHLGHLADSPEDRGAGGFEPGPKVKEGERKAADFDAPGPKKRRGDDPLPPLR